MFTDIFILGHGQNGGRGRNFQFEEKRLHHSYILQF